MNGLDYKISYSKDCSEICFTPCPTYCIETDFALDYLSANIKTVPGAEGNIISFTDNSQTTGTISTYSWVNTDSQGVITTVASVSASFRLGTGIHKVVLTVTDSNSLTSSTELYYNETGVIVTAGLNLNLTQFPYVEFRDSTGYGAFMTSINNSVVTGDTPVVTLTNMTVYSAASHTYISDTAQTYDITYTFNVIVSGASATILASPTTTVQVKNNAGGQDCTELLTANDVDSIVLTSDTPSGVTTGSLDITEDYLAGEGFTIEAEDLNLTDFSESGIWAFRLVYKKNGGLVTLRTDKEVVIICSLLCKYNTLEYLLTNESCSFKPDSLDQFKEIKLYMSAFLDAVACNEQTQISHLIEILEINLANYDCNC